MDFLIADTFTDSLTKLTADEQRAVKTTAFDLQIDPAHPSMQLHRLERAKDDGFWSVRVNRDIRLILHKSPSSLLLCYVAHHDNAYAWAERRRLQRHPKTGAAQLVEIRETVKDIIIPNYVEQAPTPLVKPVLPALFADTPDDDLLAYGVPPEWLEDVKQATEETVLSLAEHLPQEAAEALLDLAVGAEPKVAQPIAPEADAFEHPDAQRRFRVMNDRDALERALEFPWEKWTIFLHPAQRELVEKDYGGPARVAGSAGTGKTVVALHRATYLTRSDEDARVLLTTFSDSLANALDTKLRALVSNQPRLKERIDVYSLEAVALRLAKLNGLKPVFATAEYITAFLKKHTENFSLQFLKAEWDQVIDAWQLDTWEAYQSVPRLGRRKRLPEHKREKLWSIFSALEQDLQENKLTTRAALFGTLAKRYNDDLHSPYDFVVLDEAQDVGVSQLRFLAALAGERPNGLFFAGDLGQRIFEPPFSWRSLGVDVRGRSKTLRINYRTSHQIRTYADRLLGPEIADVDGNVEKRDETISVFNGPAPSVQEFGTYEDEIDYVSDWLKQHLEEGIKPGEFGVFVRSPEEVSRAEAALKNAGIPFQIVDDNYDLQEGNAAICTMHYAKGLEFRAVVVMACDDEVIPLQSRIETASETSELDEIYNTERHLLYVACTRARDELLVTGVDPASEFIQDLTLV